MAGACAAAPSEYLAPIAGGIVQHEVYRGIKSYRWQSVHIGGVMIGT